MNKLKMPCMKSDASDSPLRSFLPGVLSVADDRMADRSKLHPDLVLQSRHQRNSYERSAPKTPFDGIAKFSTSCPGIVLGGQPLKHSFASRVVNQRPLIQAEMAANHGKILPYRSMAEKLSDECVSILLGLCKEQNSGTETIDAMYHIGPLSLRSQFRG